MKKPIEEKKEIESKDAIRAQDYFDLNKFLIDVNKQISEIRNSENKQYSILSCILNCFYEKKVKYIPKQTIFDYIRQDIINYKGKMIVSYVDNGTNNKDTIDENNYMRKTYNIISRNKCLLEDDDNNISLDMNFIEEHKSRMLKNLFGVEGNICTKSIIKKKPKKAKIIQNNTNKKIKIYKDSKTEDDDDNYEIEIIENDEDEGEGNVLKNESNVTKIDTIKKDSKKSNLTSTNYCILDSNSSENQNVMSNSTSKIMESPYLNKKRKRINLKVQKIEKSEEKEKELSDDKFTKKDTNIDDSDISTTKDNNIKENKIELKAEKEILSLIEEGKLFLTLFKDKKLLNELENQNNDNIDDENDSFVKSILLKYQNEDTLKKYLNILNNDYTEFQNSLKALIDYKSSLDESNDNKFLAKFSLMNKIILGKEKCSLLIDKIVIKLRQLILEYNFLQKVLNKIDANKADIFKKFKNVISNVNKKQDKENYVNDLKNQLQNELCKALIVDKK